MAVPVPAHLADQFSKLDALQCILLIPSICNDDEIKLGSTKFGGNPDISTGKSSFGGLLATKPFEIPFQAEFTTRFIGQINFAEINHLDCNNRLPKDGLLSIFLLEAPDRYDTQIVLHHFKKGEPLARIDSETMGIRTGLACSLEPHAHHTLPAFLPRDFKSDDVDDDDFDDLMDEYEEFQNCFDKAFLDQFYPGKSKFDANTPMHQIYGYHRDIQCSGRVPGGKERWHLLLQIGSHSQAQMVFADCGQIYLWIKDEDLRRGDFSRVEMELVSF